LEKRTQAKEDLERRIAQKLRLAASMPDLSHLTPQKLGTMLPPGAAFLDLLRYVRLNLDPKRKGMERYRPTPCYVAFVLSRDKPTVRVELNDAEPIEKAWAAWHQALTARRPEEAAERQAAAALGKLIWEPLREHLPADLHTLCLAPDQALAQVPWAALPGKKPDTVLLEDCAVCLVPHGPWLLQRLTKGRPVSAEPEALLAAGGVDYDRGPNELRPAHRGAESPEPPPGTLRVSWPPLPGTERERRQVAELVRRATRWKVIERGGRAASTEQLLRDLPSVRYAHLATHGFFADPQFRSAFQFDPQDFAQLQIDQFGFGERRRAARSPLVLSGLALAGANRTGKERAPDRGILTAETIVGLRLEGLELAVLSACQTGLGEAGGGEGVFGLQRAFHLAGCRNVIASLWSVDDDATAALMILFYRNLLEKHLDVADALRQAQLTLYRHPEAVAMLKKRGSDFTESDLPKGKSEAGVKHKCAPTVQWAAFTFSGLRPGK
jgi:CHAT domain-containing protein